MTQYLPPNLLALFAPREPIPYLPPVDVLPYEKKTAGYTGVAAFVNQFEDPTNAPPPTRIETREERQERRRREKAEQVAYQLEQDIALWNPSSNPNLTTDPYKTLFVARVNYDTTEAKLLREFEMYGDIRKTSIIFDNTKDARKPRGYAFIEYERERDMHSAYKHADGKKIDGRRVLVDVERGRTVKGWLPRRLGGGLGGTRRGGPEVNVKHSGREEPSRPEERYNMNRERDRGDRPDHRRSRSRSRERRRRSRSRSRDRHRRDRHKRDRSRDRDRTREHEANAGGEKTDGAPEPAPEAAPDGDARRRRRSRSRDRDRRRRRSRSRDRKDRDSRRDKDKDKDRERERDSRRERDRPREEEEIAIKEEPPAEINQEMYGHENNGGFEEDYRNYNNMQNQTNYEGY